MRGSFGGSLCNFDGKESAMSIITILIVIILILVVLYFARRVF